MDQDTARAAPPDFERIARILLSVATVAVVATVVLAVAWYRAVHAETRLEDLPDEEREKLVKELVAVSPGVYTRPWYEPAIGYTFKPSQPIELDYDTFTANELGYRTGPVEKSPGVFRVVFVGDSWTFGVGVREDQTFAKVFERIANRESGQNERIESWTLALSGYNTINELAAFWFFIERLRPDAVVICPTTNDNESGNEVLSSGFLTRFGKTHDYFGDPHPVAYRVPVDSFRYWSRWRFCFQKLRETEERLRDLDIPLMFYFVARWTADQAHTMVGQAGLRSPYIITPSEYFNGSWLNPAPFRHGNPEANEVYGRMVYQCMARMLGWPELPPAGDASDVEIFTRPPEGVDWTARNNARLARFTRRYVPESFHPHKGASYQTSGPIHPWTGDMGRATTVLVSYREGARSLEIALQRLETTHYLYPLTITVSIPSAGGGTRTRTTVPARGPALHRFTVDIPPDVRPGQALDVVFEAERATAGFRDLHGHTVRIKSIDQRD